MAPNKIAPRRSERGCIPAKKEGDAVQLPKKGSRTKKRPTESDASSDDEVPLNDLKKKKNDATTNKKAAKSRAPAKAAKTNDGADSDDSMMGEDLIPPGIDLKLGPVPPLRAPSPSYLEMLSQHQLTGLGGGGGRRGSGGASRQGGGGEGGRWGGEGITTGARGGDTSRAAADNSNTGVAAGSGTRLVVSAGNDAQLPQRETVVFGNATSVGGAAADNNGIGTVVSGVAVVGEAASGNAYGSAVGTASGNNSSESAAGGMGGGGAVVASLSEMPTHFQVLQPPQKYYVSEQEVKDAAVAILKPYGIDRFVIGHSSRSNDNPTTKENFPRKRFHLLCGCCNNTIKDMDSATQGCCGFKLRLLLVENEYDEPHLEIREFCFPATSRHRLVSAEARAASESKVVVNEDMLTPTKESLLKNLGKVRARSNLVKSVFADQFDGMQLEKNLMHRMMRKGRDEAFGATDSESMIMFYGGGIKLREVDDEYKVGGKFGVRTCASSGELVAWFEQSVPFGEVECEILCKTRSLC